jgi:hypothetical protein
MTNIEFRVWVNGYIALSEKPTLDRDQLQILNNHANLVYAIEGRLDPDIQIFLEHCQAGLQSNCTLLLEQFNL